MRTWSNWDGTSISIHAPPRGATSASHCDRARRTFQFTPLREGRRGVHCAAGWRTTYFNSRPSARGDDHRHRRQRAGTISIHAPPRGATRIRPNITSVPHISIHAPPRGATHRHLHQHLHRIFQFTPLREGRPLGQKALKTGSISIHAPPRGATQSCTALAHSHRISIHAPPRGATQPEAGLQVSRDYFNSRPSARGDSYRRHYRGVDEFQFTPLREGRRINMLFMYTR